MMESSNYRMVALKIHSLHPADRKWLLNQFAPAQQRALRQLIHELDQIGLVANDELPVHVPAFPTGKMPLDSTAAETINRASAQCIHDVVDNLSERLKAVILYASPWQWSSEYWNSLMPQERDRILRHVGACEAIKPAVFQAVVMLLAAHIGNATLGTSGHALTMPERLNARNA